MRTILLVSLLLAAAQAGDEVPEAIRAKLARDGIAIDPAPLKQVFEPYIGSGTPVFVTSDSILTGFHVLFEESVLRLEDARAATLGDAVAFLYGATDGLKEMKIAPAVREAAARRLRIFLATALLLLGRDVPGGAPAEAKEEAARIEKAEGMSKPSWLGPPDDGFRAIDYGRFKPRGFYVRTPGLERYFRALSWLQAVPFRIDRDEEFVAILMLHKRLGGTDDGADEDACERARDALAGYRPLLGAADDLTVADAAVYWTDDLKEMRAHYREWQEDPERVNDQVARTKEASVRVVGAARMPDSVLFDKAQSASGLMVAAALGSAWARGKLEPKAVVAVDATKEPFEAYSLYAVYLQCVAALLDAPEPDAPALFKGPLWHVKSCQTALGGWAQIRHTWTLQAKRTAYALCDSDELPGLVEPEPEFFARLGRLARDTRDALREQGAFDLLYDRRALVAQLRKLRALMGERSEEQLKDEAWRDDPGAQLAIRAGQHLAYVLGAGAGLEDWVALRKIVDECLPTLGDESRELTGPLLHAVEGTRLDLERRWQDLEYVCVRLESLAHKQLRGIAFSGPECDFVASYGEWLAGIMFYGGNSYFDPKDDAMRVCDVSFDPLRGERLHVGVGRPHRIWVVYPWQGKDVICVGGVMSYYEFEHETPLTDAEWKSLLDSPDAPKVPSWAEPLYAR